MNKDIESFVVSEKRVNKFLALFAIGQIYVIIGRFGGISPHGYNISPKAREFGGEDTADTTGSTS